jgi:molybdopterin-guanine dinucleotide biosynthesis protein A/nitroreductase
VTLHPLLAARWSPRRLDPDQVLTREDLLPLLEAARWAPSSGNTQPTRFVVALRGEPLHARLMGALKRGNRTWAGRAAALVVVVSLAHDETGRSYPSGLHDAGQAAAHLSLQAEAQGLHVHQMGGFDADAVRVAAGLSEAQRPVVVAAVGAEGGPPLDERLAAREAEPRTRRPLEELVLPGRQPFDAVVLAGGSARRLGGVDKPGLDVGGRSLLDRVLTAASGAALRVVVGPPRPLPEDVVQVREDPPGGGPVPALRAGLSLVRSPWVVVLAADLPFLDAQLLDRLLTAAQRGSGALLVDDSGREQWLCGVWSTAALQQASWATPRVRDVLAALDPVRVGAEGGDRAPWLDCDTPEDLERARRAAGA